MRDTDDPFTEHALTDEQGDDDDDDETRIDFAFTDAAAEVAAVTSIAQEAIGAGNVSNVQKLSVALSRMSASRVAVTSDEPWTMASIQSDKAAKPVLHSMAGREP